MVLCPCGGVSLAMHCRAPLARWALAYMVPMSPRRESAERLKGEEDDAIAQIREIRTPGFLRTSR